jgi:hypothetical protein
MKIKRAKHQFKNLNRIVRVRESSIHHCIINVSNSLGLPYQTVFEDWCELMTKGYTHGVSTMNTLFHYCLDKHTSEM